MSNSYKLNSWIRMKNSLQCGHNGWNYSPSFDFEPEAYLPKLKLGVSNSFNVDKVLKNGIMSVVNPNFSFVSR